MTTNSTAQKKDMLKINVASGYNVSEDAINLDNSIFLRFLPVYPVLKPFLKEGYREFFEKFADAKKRAHFKLHNCSQPLPFAENSVDYVVCTHFLEHVYPQEADRILKDFFRVLKPGGTLELGVPGLAPMVKSYIDTGRSDEFLSATVLSHEKPPSLKYRALELCGLSGMQHRWLYDAKSLTTRLSEAGFKINRVDDGDMLLTYSTKP